jgi:magnesium-dependent phosphatase 1
MFEMPAVPDRTATGDLNGNGQGVIGAYSGSHKISMHKGSMIALQEHAQHKYPGMKICFASSADTPFAEQIGRATLKLLEVVPGMTVWELVMRDWDNRDVNQIGRQPPLSSNKAQTHFPRIRQLTGISYDKMLFFDDCNWGDHCGMVARACQENGKPVVTHRTPNGLREVDWRKGLELYKQAHAD